MYWKKNGVKEPTVVKSETSCNKNMSSWLKTGRIIRIEKFAVKIASQALIKR
jgi:hypothetical protein